MHALSVSAACRPAVKVGWHPCISLMLAFWILFGSAHAQAALFHRRRFSPAAHSAALSQRKRLHVNDLIAEPGTLEIDFGGLYSYTTAEAWGPATLKYTPAGNSLWIGRTEYSFAFDSFDTAIDVAGRTLRSTDHATFAATSVVYDGEHFALATAMQGTKLLRDGSGARFGASVIARYDRGGNSVGAGITWSGATCSSSTNPAGIWDVGIGYGRALSRTGRLSRATPHVNVIMERPSGLEMVLTAVVGSEYQITRRFAVDLSVQRSNFGGTLRDRQIAISTTWNVGRVR